MKSFIEIREANKTLFDKKIDGIPVKIVKEKKGVCAYVDGDKLDIFKNMEEALDSVKTVIKELK